MSLPSSLTPPFSPAVLFRVVALDTAVKMVEDSVDVFILSPSGVLVRRWLSRQVCGGVGEGYV